ncbi:MAG: GNAT family N-acetyltransferase [Anaerolineae bacterium]|nr:GNAT family N-acetyltransferase [Anaerolineae bacterium]
MVDSAYREQGVAAEMLEKILKRTEHVEIVMLDCDSNLAGFYGKFGFEQKGGASMELRNKR